MKKIKALLAEFKAFITRGNVVDMAVAVIIGAAFGAIVTAMTNGIIKPLVDWAMSGMSGDAAGLITVLKPVYTQVPAAEGSTEMVTILDKAKSIYIDWGTFIMKVIDFLIIALVLFAVIKVFMSLKNATGKAQEKAKARVAKKLKKQGLSEEEAQAKAEEQVAAEAAAAPAEPPRPTTDELLTEIRDLLAAQNKGGSDTARE